MLEETIGMHTVFIHTYSQERSIFISSPRERIMSIDFVQLRWQQIRQTEAMQLLESENVALRREIQELKNIKPVVVQAVDPNAGSDKKLIKKFAINMKTIMMRTQSELMKLKLVSVQEINIMMNQRNQLSTAFDNLFTAYRVKEAEYEALEAERDDLQEKLDFAQQSLEEGANHQTAELNKMKAKYKQARADLKDAQAEQERLNDALKSLNEKYNSLRSAKVEADANYEVISEILHRCLSRKFISNIHFALRRVSTKSI